MRISAHSLRRIGLLVAIFLVLSTMPLHSQSPEKPNALAPGVWSLQFAIGENFRLSSFQGSTVSARKQISERHAWRFGISLGASFTSQVDEQDGSQANTRENDINSQLIGTQVQYLVTPRTASAFVFYFGAGPTLRFQRNFNKAEPEASSVRTERSTTIWRFGAGAVLGGEWFVKPSISLFGEYSSSLTYRHSKQTTKSELTESGAVVNREESRAGTLSLDPGGVTFGASIYF